MRIVEQVLMEVRSMLEVEAVGSRQAPQTLEARRGAAATHAGAQTKRKPKQSIPQQSASASLANSSIRYREC